MQRIRKNADLLLLPLSSVSPQRLMTIAVDNMYNIVMRVVFVSFVGYRVSSVFGLAPRRLVVSVPNKIKSVYVSWIDVFL